jgi:hypothetical protein
MLERLDEAERSSSALTSASTSSPMAPIWIQQGQTGIWIGPTDPAVHPPTAATGAPVPQPDPGTRTPAFGTGVQSARVSPAPASVPFQAPPVRPARLLRPARSSSTRRRRRAPTGCSEAAIPSSSFGPSGRWAWPEVPRLRPSTAAGGRAGAPAAARPCSTAAAAGSSTRSGGGSRRNGEGRATGRRPARAAAGHALVGLARQKRAEWQVEEAGRAFFPLPSVVGPDSESIFP